MLQCTHVVDLELALVLFLQVARQLVEYGPTTPAVVVKAWGTGDLVHLQTCLLVWGPAGRGVGVEGETRPRGGGGGRQDPFDVL